MEQRNLNSQYSGGFPTNPPSCGRKVRLKYKLLGGQEREVTARFKYGKWYRCAPDKPISASCDLTHWFCDERNLWVELPN